MISKEDIDKNAYALAAGVVIAVAVLSFFSYKFINSIGTPKFKLYLSLFIFSILAVLAAIYFVYWALSE